MNLEKVWQDLAVKACMDIHILEENEASPGTVMASIPCQNDQDAEQTAKAIQDFGYGKNWMHWEKPIEEEDDYVFDFDV